MEPQNESRGLNCLSAVEAIGSREIHVVAVGVGKGLNCLSAVEAIGSSYERSVIKAFEYRGVSIAFRLLKRLVAS